MQTGNVDLQMIGKTRTLEWNATDEHKSSPPVHKQIRLSISLISWYTIWENNSSVNSCFESQNGTNGYFFPFSSIIGQKRTCARKKKIIIPKRTCRQFNQLFNNFEWKQQGLTQNAGIPLHVQKKNWILQGTGLDVHCGRRRPRRGLL